MYKQVNPTNTNKHSLHSVHTRCESGLFMWNCSAAWLCSKSITSPADYFGCRNCVKETKHPMLFCSNSAHVLHSYGFEVQCIINESVTEMTDCTIVHRRKAGFWKHPNLGSWEKERKTLKGNEIERSRMEKERSGRWKRNKKESQEIGTQACRKMRKCLQTAETLGKNKCHCSKKTEAILISWIAFKPTAH